MSDKDLDRYKLENPHDAIMTFFECKTYFDAGVNEFARRQGVSFKKAFVTCVALYIHTTTAQRMADIQDVKQSINLTVDEFNREIPVEELKKKIKDLMDGFGFE